MYITTSNIVIIGERLRPGTDLLREIKRVVADADISCGIILSIVGSLSQCVLRLVFNPQKKYLVYDKETGEKMKDAKVYDVLRVEGPLEILCGGGTIAKNGHPHIHLVVSDPQGRVFGGHIIEGCKTYTTVELFLVNLPEVIATRVFNSETKHKELRLDFKEKVVEKDDNHDSTGLLKFKKT